MPGAASRYHESLAAARDVALQLTLQQQRELLGILEEYAREIEARVSRGVRFASDAQLLREISALVDEMSQTLAEATGDGVRLTARRVAEIQASATAELLSAAGFTPSVAGLFGTTGVRAAQAMLARPELAEAFVSIRRDAVDAANRILRRGLLRGAPAQAIARELRQYISMPNSLLEGDGTLLSDRRRIGYAAIKELGYEATVENLYLVRSEASQIAYRASRIARTEVMQAEAEAYTQGAADSLVVAYVEIRLSYRHVELCACEPIAELDLYGFGPGVYDPRQTPPRPHPHCFCPRRTILRPVEEWGRPRGPLPELKVEIEREAAAAGLSPSGQTAFARAVEAGRARTAASDPITDRGRGTA